MQIKQISDPVDRFFAFCHERYMIHVRRQSGTNPPWTKDSILANYRFTNVYREWDRITIWIRENWREPHADDPYLWFAMCIARLLNRPDSLAVIDWPVPWNIVDFAHRLKRYRLDGGKVFNGAYIVSTNGIASDKLSYLAHSVLTPLWSNRKILRPKEGDTLNSYHMQLGQMHGFGSFMSAQVIADLKYHYPLNKASDWETFAASGPGSRRGLNIVLERDLRSPWTEEKWRFELSRLKEKVTPMFEKAQMPKLHAQDLQNCLCEYSKWSRATFDDKPPKQRYHASAA